MQLEREAREGQGGRDGEPSGPAACFLRSLHLPCPLSRPMSRRSQRSGVLLFGQHHDRWQRSAAARQRGAPATTVSGSAMRSDTEKEPLGRLRFAL